MIRFGADESSRACQDGGLDSEKGRMLQGEPYLANDPALLRERRQCRLMCERFNATSFGETAARRVILHELLGELGEDVEVMAPFQCDYGYQISIGARTFINYGAVVLDGAKVTIGQDVQVGPSVMLLTALHPLDPDDRRRGIETAAPVTIGDGAWLASGVIVCPGVSIGADAVIGAGSVVTKDMPAGHLCYGNPCRVIRETD
ncbi:MAG: sugar O-acetyltransferase [Solirubrobacterales bacterium]|nr:sugar O-acetyltransferase [Solirubrobacterales bacterium]